MVSQGGPVNAEFLGKILCQWFLAALVSGRRKQISVLDIV